MMLATYCHVPPQGHLILDCSTAPGWRLRATPDVFELHVADASFANHARRAFRNYLGSNASADSDIDAAELIFGELVANVARHAPGALQVTLSWIDEGALLEVQDTGPGFDRTIELPGANAENQRGLYIVSVMASSFTQRPHPDGSVVIVALPVRKARPA